MLRFALSILLFFLGIYPMLAQKMNNNLELQKKASDNHSPSRDYELMLVKADSTILQAQKLNLPLDELSGLSSKCNYFNGIHDFKNLLKTAQTLFEKATEYKNPAYQAIAKKFLSDSFLGMNLFDEAIRQLDEGRIIINRVIRPDQASSRAKADLWTGYANFYAQRGDYENKLKYIKLSGQEYKKNMNPDHRPRLLYIHYSNLAGVFDELDQPDSASYYALLSEALASEEFCSNIIRQKNFGVLGSAAMKNEEWSAALQYFEEAEKLEASHNYVNILHIYDLVIESYRAMGNEDSASVYVAKRDSLRLAVTDSQNQSLLYLLGKKDEKIIQNWTKYLIALAFAFVALVVFYIIRNRHKHPDTNNDHESNHSAIEANIDGRSSESDYSKLSEMLMNNDPLFLSYFDEIFPEFSTKLTEITPEISTSEMEFCAILKLKIPTKDIARYRHRSPKTVQNKKYLIRKKLNIPPEVDTYQWFDEF